MDNVTEKLPRLRTYKKPENLRMINYNREAEFVFKDGSTYYGYCDGEISADGYFYIDGTVCSSAHLLDYLEKWRYL